MCHHFQSETHKIKVRHVWISTQAFLDFLLGTLKDNYLPQVRTRGWNLKPWTQTTNPSPQLITASASQNVFQNKNDTRFRSTLGVSRGVHSSTSSSSAATSSSSISPLSSINHQPSTITITITITIIIIIIIINFTLIINQPSSSSIIHDSSSIILGRSGKQVILNEVVSTHLGNFPRIFKKL